MATNRVDELFDIAAIDAQKAKIAAMLNDIKTNLDDLQKLGKSIQIGGSIGGSASNIDAANKAMVEFTNNLNTYTAAVKSASAARVTSMKLSDEEAMKSKVNQTSLNKELKEQVQLASNLTSAYDKLNLAHKQAVKEYQNAAAAAKLSATEITALKDRANDLGQQLFKIDTAVGNYRRNVGNYSSAWNGLGVSIQQVAREMPNFAQSFQLGILAISNNLPILADEIKKAKDNIAGLKAEGKDAPSLFSQIASSVFSWQTALTIGITLLVKYGAEIADWVMQVSDAEKAIRKYRDALNESLKAESEGISKLYVLKAALADTTNARSNDLAAFSAVKKEYPEYFDYLNTEKASLKDLNLIIDQQIKARIENAKQVALNKVAADATNEYVQAQNNLNKEIGFWEKNTSFAIINSDKLTTETKRLYQAYRILFEEGKIGYREWIVYQNRIEDISNAEKQMTLSTNALTKSLLKLKDAVNSMDEDELINLENNVIKYKEGTKERLNAEILFIKQKRDIKIRQLQQEFNGDAMLLAGNKRYQAEKLNIELKAQREIESIRNSFAKGNKTKKDPNADNLEKFQKDIFDKAKEKSEAAMKKIMDGMNDIALEQTRIQEQALSSLVTQLEEGVIGVQEYNAKKTQITSKTEEEILRLQLESIRKYLEAEGLLMPEIQKIEEKITDLTKSELEKRNKAREAQALASAKNLQGFQDAMYKDKAEKDKKQQELEDERDKKIKQQARDLYNYVVNLYSAQSEKRIETLNKEKEAVSNRYDQEREAVDAAFLADEEKAARKKVLDAEEAERQKEIDADIRKEKRKQAILSKMQALADVAIKTAQAIMASVAASPLTGGLPWSAAAAGLGAAQAAAIIATPIPEYAKGKKETDSYEGLAIVGEKGTELMIDKEGKLSLLTKPTLINTRRGDRIYSNQELRQGVANERIAEAQVYDNTEVVRALGYGFGSLNSTIKNKKPDTIILDQTRYYDLQRAARR